MSKRIKKLKVRKNDDHKFPITEEDLRFASANQKLAGFPGAITDAMRNHRPDRDAIVKSAERFGAQVSPRMRRLAAAARRAKKKAATNNALFFACPDIQLWSRCPKLVRSWD